MLLQMLPLVLAMSGQAAASPPQQVTAQAPRAAPSARPARPLYDEQADAQSKIADALKAAETDNAHQVPPTDAAPLFKAALEQAKAENKDVFLWFSAPW